MKAMFELGTGGSWFLTLILPKIRYAALSTPLHLALPLCNTGSVESSKGILLYALARHSPEGWSEFLGPGCTVLKTVLTSYLTWESTRATPLQSTRKISSLACSFHRTCQKCGFLRQLCHSQYTLVHHHEPGHERAAHCFSLARTVTGMWLHQDLRKKKQQVLFIFPTLQQKHNCGRKVGGNSLQEKGQEPNTHLSSASCGRSWRDMETSLSLLSLLKEIKETTWSQCT